MRRLPPTILLLALLLAPAAARGQEPAEERAVIAAVQSLFDAMAARDTAAARAVLLPEGAFISVRAGDAGEPRVTSHRAFVEALAGATEPWIERIWQPTVLVHGPVATLWAPYDFHRGDAFSHCGVDALNLVRTAAGWKIAGGVYTVEREGCPASPLGPPGTGAPRR